MIGYDETERYCTMKNPILQVMLVILSITITSCALPGSRAQVKRDIVQTEVAERLVSTGVIGTLTAILPTETITPSITPTLTVIPTVSSTPRPTMTPTMAGVWLTVQEITSCRSGPDSTFSALFQIDTGQLVEAMAREPVSNYYYVRDPNNFSNYCWVWAGHTSVQQGNIARLPEFTPQPYPTSANPSTATPAFADFTVRYDGFIVCKESYAIVLYVENTGSLIWKSVRVLLTDTGARRSTFHTADLFRGVKSDPCVIDMDNGQADLMFGEGSLVACVNSGQFNYNPAGREFTASVTLYNKDGRYGTSVTKVITFTP